MFTLFVTLLPRFCHTLGSICHIFATKNEKTAKKHRKKLKNKRVFFTKAKK